jgi:hypothetical protein
METNMEFELKGNVNYAASIVEIKNIIDLEGCDNIKHTIVMGNSVIISKDCKVGDVGVFFPIECKISEEFLACNNLFDKPEMNRDKTKKGFFSHKGRVRCVKLRGFRSEGFFIPLNSLNYIVDVCDRNIESVEIGTVFDHINGNKVCEKYIVPCKNSGTNKRSETKANKKFDRIIPEIFKFHIDTEQLGRNIHRINPEDICTISRKIHGTSAILAYISVRRELSFIEKLLKKIGVKINEIEYDYIRSSRKVIKNKYINKEVTGGYYGTDIWEVASEELKPFIKKDMTIYFEIAGYISEDKMIQKYYDYGCKPGEHKNFVYRITTTNPDGNVVEWPMLQVSQFCKANGLNAVPLLYYGTAKDLFFDLKSLAETNDDRDKDEWRNKFLEALTNTYLEKMCPDCGDGTNTPDEGIVLRKETLGIDCWKHKSFLFRQHETKQKDAEEVDIEDEQSVEETV